jgi:diacylglycerol kinase (ATP)
MTTLRQWQKCTTAGERWQHAKAGLRVCWRNSSFRTATLCCTLFWCLAFCAGCTWHCLATVALAFCFAMTVEQLNTALELAVDHTSLKWHPLARDAKDVAGAASTLAFTCAFVLAILSTWAAWLSRTTG